MKTELERIREELGWTQAAMAKAIGLSLRAYADAERDPAKQRQSHLLAAEMVRTRTPRPGRTAVSLDELAGMFAAAQARIDALPYTVTLEVDPDMGVLLARGELAVGMTSRSALTGRPLADVLANPEKELGYMLAFIAASMNEEV